jgi:hypothetical protein
MKQIRDVLAKKLKERAELEREIDALLIVVPLLEERADLPAESVPAPVTMP